MASTKLISPGIPNYTLKRNLKIGSHYISNDGDNEGLAISADGTSNFTSSGDASGIGLSASKAYGGTTTAFVTAFQSLTTCSSNIAGGQSYAQYAAKLQGTYGGTNSGTVSTYGLDIAITGNATGTSTGIGIDIDVSGADSNYGILCASTDRQLRLGYDAASYLDITVANDSHTTIANAESGNLTLDVAGDIVLDAAGNNIQFKAGAQSQQLRIEMIQAASNNNFYMYSPGSTDDYFRYYTSADGVTVFLTIDADGADADMYFSPDGNLDLDATGTVLIHASPNNAISVSPDTKTASSVFDTTLLLAETLNLSSGAGGGDTHFGLAYFQTQTDLTGWNTVYLAYINGGVGKILSIDSNANLTLSDNRKVIFGDAGEYIVGDGTDLDIVSSNDLILDAAGDITLDVAGNDIKMLGSAGAGLNFAQASSDWTIVNLSSDQDIIFGCIESASYKEVMRIDASATSLLIASGKKVEFGAAEEYIYGDGTDIHFGVGSGGDINIPSGIGLTFADDGEKIESNGTHLSIFSGGNIRFTATGEIDFGSSSAGFAAQSGTDAVSIDWGAGNKYHLLLETSSTVTFATNPTRPCNLLLKIAQGDGGSNTITWAVTSGTIYWAGGGVLNTDEPTLTTTDDKTDILSFYFDGTNYFGVASLNFDTT